MRKFSFFISLFLTFAQILLGWFIYSELPLFYQTQLTETETGQSILLFLTLTLITNIYNIASKVGKFKN